MAISISLNKSKEVVMILNGCYHKDICRSNGCYHFEYFKTKIDIYKPNTISQMYLYLAMGRKERLNNLIKKYNEYFFDRLNENGIDYLKKIILEDLENDSLRKTCIKCKKLYEENKIKFEDIMYILRNLDYCLDHN